MQKSIGTGNSKTTLSTWVCIRVSVQLHVCVCACTCVCAQVHVCVCGNLMRVGKQFRYKLGLLLYARLRRYIVQTCSQLAWYVWCVCVLHFHIHQQVYELGDTHTGCYICHTHLPNVAALLIWYHFCTVHGLTVSCSYSTLQSVTCTRSDWWTEWCSCRIQTGHNQIVCSWLIAMCNRDKNRESTAY